MIDFRAQLKLTTDKRDYLFTLKLFERLSLLSPWTRKYDRMKAILNSEKPTVSYYEHIRLRAKQTHYYFKTTPKYPDFTNPITRFLTVLDNDTNPIPPEVLAMAGFFLNNDSMKIYCFHCGWENSHWTTR